jgi:putative tryptophan/tyrosine transport system substrate-binding protein
VGHIADGNGGTVKTLTLIMLLTLSLGHSSSVWCAALQGKVYRIGYLALAPITDPPPPQRAAFLHAMEKLGYVQGKNLIIEYRSAESNIEMLTEAVEDLVERKPALIFAIGTPTALAAKHATQTIPIVMLAFDAVPNGVVPNLARPGGNVTGLSLLQVRISPKRLEILKEALPNVTRVAVLWSRAHPAHAHELKMVGARANELGIALQPFDVTALADLQAAFASMSSAKPDAILVGLDYRTMAYRELIADFATKKGLPTMFASVESVHAGGLMSYGPNLTEVFARAATIVDRILNGALPATLPVEQPTRIDLVINRRTARALGLEFPDALLLRANLLIE